MSFILIMKLANASKLDLNLLRVFLAIWEQRSLTAAGVRLKLTQPAVSHALRRLREMFDDPLFVRTANVMTPTEAATRLHGPIDQALGIVNRAMHDHGAFDPATAKRIFRVSMSDMSEFYYLPSLLAELERVAPAVRLDIVPLSAGSVGAAMRAGEVDLALGFIPGLEEDVLTDALFSDGFVCLVRAGHPIARKSLTIPALRSLRYIYADIGATGHQMIEQWLSDSGIKRQIGLRIARFTVAPEIVRKTDLAVIFPKSVAVRFNQEKAFCLMNLPFDLPTVEVGVHTHSHFGSDLGIRWLRKTLVTMFAQTRTSRLRDL
jgi:DNA-binding transcriptional LysR family regulator